MTPVSKIMTIFIIGLFTAGLAYFILTTFIKNDRLPVLGEPGHIAGSFAFTNQAGGQITEKDVEGKITVVEYFFTRCAGICPVMTKNLSKVYQQFKEHPDFTILSHSVDPERDLVTVMAAYAHKFNAQLPVWQFLTGNKYDLYKAAREDYLLAVEDTVADNREEDFIHTEYVALLDKQRRIRGFYNATDSASIEKMMRDITILYKE